MEEIQKSKLDIRKNMASMIGKLSKTEIAANTTQIEERLFDFANFLESKIALLYIGHAGEVSTDAIIKRTYDLGKIVVLPLVTAGPKIDSQLYKIDDFDRDMKPGPNGLPLPDPGRCRPVPIDCIDIAIIPGIAFDEKGGRIGVGDGYYDRLIPSLPITTRKVALAFDSQVIAQVPTESHDKFVDIIITEKRIIYKI
jgi:5-formyltetrahydrofolate cyclo-ligase